MRDAEKSDQTNMIVNITSDLNFLMNVTMGAFHNDRIIGRALLSFRPRKERIKHIGVWSVAVNPDYHNLGIGSKLILELERIAKKNGLKKLEASFASKNHIADHVYIDKLGYTIEGKRIMAHLYDDGTYDDVILIGKIIG